MMNRPLCSKRFCWLGLLSALALMLCFSTAALGANSIRGSVRNQSRGEPAAGDDVILIRLDGGMQKEARTKTDALWAFTLDVQHPDKPYLVRAIHQGVSYDQPVSARQALAIEVFDAAAQVQGIIGTIEILRTGINGDLLHISDMVEIKNASSPPLTQAGERPFEVYLPANARIDSVLAVGDRAPSHQVFQSPASPNPTQSPPARVAVPSSAIIDSHLKQTQPPSQSFVLGGVTSVLLAACALLVWRARKERSFSAAQSVAQRGRQAIRPEPDWKL
jgi:hypothetical protein